MSKCPSQGIKITRSLKKCKCVSIFLAMFVYLRMYVLISIIDFKLDSDFDGDIVRLTFRHLPISFSPPEHWKEHIVQMYRLFIFCLCVEEMHRLCSYLAPQPFKSRAWLTWCCPVGTLRWLQWRNSKQRRIASLGKKIFEESHLQTLPKLCQNKALHIFADQIWVPAAAPLWFLRLPPLPPAPGMAGREVARMAFFGETWGCPGVASLRAVRTVAEFSIVFSIVFL